MQAIASELVDAIPLAKDEHGVFRVGGTNVTLDIVVNAFRRGSTAEEIAQDFTSLQLPDIYLVIGYYLRHSSELAGYFDQRVRAQQEILDTHREDWSPSGFRDRLLARRKSP